MASGMPEYSRLRYAGHDGKPPTAAAGPVPLPWGAASLLIAALSGGLWLGIFRLLGALL